MFKSLSVGQNHRYFFTLSWYNASATKCRAATSPGQDFAPEKPVNLRSQKELKLVMGNGKKRGMFSGRLEDFTQYVHSKELRKL